MGLYDDNGYLNFDMIYHTPVPFIFVVGGRGTGKTYGALKYVVQHNIKFIFLRRNQTIMDIINKPEFSPFKSLNTDLDWNITTKALTKFHAGFYEGEEMDGDIKPTGAPLGYTMALSTVSHLRGFDASDVDVIIYDEFIPEKHERPLKNEAAALWNAYETINRNRELSGKDPVKLICLANANNLANSLFIDLGLVTKADQMIHKQQSVSIMRDRQLALYMLDSSPISTRKQQTALYQLTRGSDFEAMSIGNSFVEDRSAVDPRPLREFRPLVTVGELTVYQHKSDGSLYVSKHRLGSPETYGTQEMELARFRRKYHWIWIELLEGNLTCEDYLTESLLTKYYKES